MASTQIENPTAAIGVAEPSWRHQAIVAAARHQRFDAVAQGIFLGVQLEFEAGVVIEPAAERGREACQPGVDAARGHEADAAFELIDRSRQVEFCVGRQGAQLRNGFIGIARDRKKALDDVERVARQRATLQRRLFEKAVGDFGDRAAADIGGAGDRHQVGHQRQRRLAVGAGKRCQHALIFVAAGGCRERQPLDVLGEADLAVEILDQPPPPDRVEVERVDQRREQGYVAGADFDFLQSACGGGLQCQRQHFRVRRGAVLPAEGFDAGLQELARLAAAITKHRSEIAEARRLPGAAGGEIVARDRDGQVRAQAELFARGVGGQIQALADVLAGEVEERLGRLQDPGLGPDVAGLRKRQQQRVRPGGGSGSTIVGGGNGHFNVQMAGNCGFRAVPRVQQGSEGSLAQPLAWPGLGFDRDWPTDLMCRALAG